MQNPTSSQTAPTKWVHELPSYTAIVDSDLNLIDASFGWFNHFGLTRKNTLGKYIYDIMPNLKECWEDSFEYALEGIEDIKILELEECGTKSSSFALHLNPWKDGYGNIIGLVITLKENKGNYTNKEISKFDDLSTCLNEAEMGSWEYRVKERSMYFSKESHALLNVPPTIEPSFLKVLTLFKNENERALLRKVLRDALASGKPWEETFEINDFTGNPIVLRVVGRPKFKNGKCARIIGAIEAVSQDNPINTKKDRKSKKTSAAEINYDFFDAAPTGLVLIDLKEDKILRVNNYLLGLFGKSEGVFKGRNFSDFVTIDAADKQPMNEALSTQFRFDNVKLTFEQSSIGKYRFNISGNIVDDEILLVACKDITRTDQLEKSFSESLNKANEEIDKMIHFAHMVSHNLKAHTTNFDLLLNFLNNEGDEKERAQLIKMLFQSTDALTNTIKGLRELVAIRHMKNEKKSSLTLNDFLYKVIQSNNGLIKKKNAKIHNEVADDFKVNSIPAYLESILANLLLNAIHFVNENDKPMVIINAEVEKDYAVLTIEDNSMGINLSKEGDKVFALYRKLQNMGENTSMGLYLSKYQVELMGGKITVDSEVGKGNLFQVYFPL